ncbi:MAG TPA: 2Fe-2S iron-sulfur cluster-binding protein [Thermoanaerobaculia bacterium]|nr:2Fe-2S iron-sulfur cluster-binding protein [Thermoanaerobaculia bacterium]
MAKDGKGDDLPAGGISRRDFLRGGAAVGALGSAGLLAGEMAEGAKAKPAPRMEAGVEVFGPGPVPVRLRINGKSHDLNLEPRTTLLDALRDHLELTGAKKVCDRGTCGACTVLLDGAPVYACSLLAIDVQRQPIATLEGLGRPEKLHPLQAAFVDNDAQQCGFCTPGFIMAAKALLDHNPTPSLGDVHHGLSGNFCRCGTYAGMRQAVLAAAPLMAGGFEEEPEEPEEGSGAEVIDDGDAVDAPKPASRNKKKKKRRGRG